LPGNEPGLVLVAHLAIIEAESSLSFDKTDDLDRESLSIYSTYY